MSTSSSHHHHHLIDRSSSRGGKGKADDVTHLLDPSYSSYRRTSADESSYNPFEGLGGLAGRRGLGAKSRIGREPSEVDSVEEGGMSDRVRYGPAMGGSLGGRRPGGLGGSMGAGGTYGSRPRGSGMSQAGGGGGGGGSSHRSRNQADLSLRNDIINGIDYSPRRSSKTTRDRQPSTASSAARYPPAPFQAPSTPTTTTNQTKSRRSTLLSSAATTWEEGSNEDYEDLEPPPAASSRYHSAWDYTRKGSNYPPSSPSSIVSSASPQLFPETPAQQESRRRSQEVTRMATIQSSSGAAHHHSSTKPAQPTSMSALLPPPAAGDSIFGDGSEKGGSVAGGASRGSRSSYKPMKWKNEKAGLRGGVDDDYRPPPLDETEWTCVVLFFILPRSMLTELSLSSVGLVAPTTSNEAGARLPSLSGSPCSVRSCCLFLSRQSTLTDTAPLSLRNF
jgi:hypothetical protein